MSYFSSMLMNQDVVTVSITKTNDITNHRPYSCWSDKVDTSFVPYFWTRKVIGHPISKDRLDFFLDFIPNLLMSFTLLEIDGLLFNIMHLSLDVMALPLLTNDRLKCGSILYPFNHTSGSSQGDDCISPKPQISFPRLWVILEHFVAENGKIDETLFLPQVTILIAFKQEIVDLLIGPNNTNFFRFLFWNHYCCFV